MRSPHRPFAARTQNPRKKIIKEFENHPSRLLQIAEEDERIPGISLRLATLAEHWICVSFFDIELLDSMEGAKSVGSVAEAATTAEKRSRFRRICVFCGSQCGKKPSYQEAAIELGKELVNSGIDLVYGGGSIGLMGLVSHAVHDGGRHVLGVIPKSLMLKELTGGPVGEVREVSDMHERKAEMARQADAFIALPGGYGTLEELLEVITWAQLGIHKKPVGLLNVDGFYNSLLSFIDMAVEEGFISQAARHIIISAHSAKELMRKLEECIPEYESKLVWDTTEQKPLSFVPEPESGIAS